MNGANNTVPLLQQRIAHFAEVASGTIGDMLKFQYVDSCPETGEYTMRCQTEPWMGNYLGTLHGGICATILDQAMGFVVYCVKPGEGSAPTVQLDTSYHRPLMPGSEVIVKVHVVSVTQRLIRTTAEAYNADNPDKICISGSAIHFYKPL